MLSHPSLVDRILIQFLVIHFFEVLGGKLIVASWADSNKNVNE